MNKKIEKDFSGILKIGQPEGLHDAYFRIHDDLGILLPASPECRQVIYSSSSSDTKPKEEEKWLFGLTENGYSVAFYKPNGFTVHISASVDLGKASFKTPLILQTTEPVDLDLSTFDVLEFRSGIVDLLHLPGKAVDENLFKTKCIKLRNKAAFTKSFPVTVNGENFDVEYTISFSDLTSDTGKVSDLRNNIHSVLRFHFPKSQCVWNFEKYYNYALQLFQFCTGRINVGFDVRLYKKVNGAVYTIITKIKDGFDDYANDNLHFTRVIRFDFLLEKFPQLFKLLNEKETQPTLLFLPKRNSEIGYVLYTNITDICVALEQECEFLKADFICGNKIQAKSLAKALNKLIDTTDYDEYVKNKAKGLINGNLPNLKLSLREKMFALYDEFARHMKVITEPSTHVEYGIVKTYTDEEFKKKIRQFIEIRNRTAHAGIVWNEGAEIYPHLRLIVYFNILKRAGYTIDESQMILSHLFGHLF